MISDVECFCIVAYSSSWYHQEYMIDYTLDIIYMHKTTSYPHMHGVDVKGIAIPQSCCRTCTPVHKLHVTEYVSSSLSLATMVSKTRGQQVYKTAIG